MSWQLVGQIATSTEWQSTESVSGSLFRITHSTNGDHSTDLRAIIAQAFEEGGTTTYFDAKRVTYKPEIEAFFLNQPKELADRKIAIKRLDSLLDSWDISIEVFQAESNLAIEDLIKNIQTNLEEVKMSLTNPITVNIPAPIPQEFVNAVIKTTVPPPATLANAVILAAANNSRRGLSIWNDSSGDILLEFDGVPSFTTYAVRILPGGYYESQYGFIGEVLAIFTNAGGNGALVREFVINTGEPG